MPVPTRDSELVTFAPSFSTIVSGSPATYNVSAGAVLATALTGV